MAIRPAEPLVNPGADAPFPPPPAGEARALALVQLLLAEKRTSLAALRTGVALALAPLSITTVLVTVSRLYDWLENLQFLVPLYAVLTLLMLLSLVFVVTSVAALRREGKLLAELRRQQPTLGRYIT